MNPMSDSCATLDNPLPNQSDPAILILLVRHTDLRSRVATNFIGGRYSHASIGVASDPTTFYSFSYKGFRVEKTGYLGASTPEIPSRVYRIPCTEAQEGDVRRALSRCLRRRETFRFNHLGLLLAPFRIAFTPRNRFFCSQFVASVLNRACRIGTPAWARTCLPDDLSHLSSSELIFEGHAWKLVRGARFPGCPSAGTAVTS